MDDSELRLGEISLLQSMYTDDELSFNGNCSTLDEVRLITLKLTLSDDKTIELDISFPTEYPSKAVPIVCARCPSLNEKAVNRFVQNFLREREFGVPMIFDLINWINENISTGTGHENATTNDSEKADDGVVALARLWIYSHHIYNATKRRKILANARRLNLRGFCVPGKPGLIVVEGEAKCCDEFYAEIRSWNWQKLQLKIQESSKDLARESSNDLVREAKDAEFHRLPKFSELALSVSGDKSGQDLRRYLAELGFEEMFHQIFFA